MKRSKRLLAMLLSIMMLISVVVPGLSISASAQEKPQGTSRLDPDPEPWSAKWIWLNDGNASDQWVFFRKTVTLDKVPDSVMARISIDSRYWLYINGERIIFEGQLKNGPTPDSVYFDREEIAPYLKEGKNTIAVLGNYWGNRGGVRSYSNYDTGKAGFLFEAQMGGQTIISDNTWKVKKDNAHVPTTGTQPSYRIPEANGNYDARNETPDWYKESFDDSGWANAVELGNAPCEPWGQLHLRSIPQLKDYGVKEYENKNVLPDPATATTATANYVMKMPYNAQVTPILKIDAPAGLTIRMTTDATEPIQNYYTTKAGVQEFESMVWFNGQVVTYNIPAGVKIISLGYRETGYNSEFTGSFTSEDTFLNKLWEMSLRTLYVTMRDNYMDCPDRERAQWWGDVTNESQMTFYSLDPSSYALYRKGVDTVMGWIDTKSTGDRKDVLQTVVPIQGDYFELPMQELAGIIGFWTYYQYTGEKDIIEQVYTPVKNYLAKWTMQANGLVNHRGGSWDWLDWGGNHDQAVIENAWYYWSCERAIKMAELLGNTDDIPFYISRMESIKEAYNSILWNGASYKSSNIAAPDDRGNALAVLSGLAGPEKYEALKVVFQTRKESSPYMEKYVLDALCEMGYMNEAIARMKDRYATMVNSGYSTLAELFPTGGSNNHAWSGGPMITMSMYIAGVAPITPGYDIFGVTPQLGTLNQISCVVPSIKGDIIVDINRNKEARTLDLSVTSPADTVARVAVPRFAMENTKVSLGGTVLFADGAPVDTAAGVSYDSNDAGYIYFNVQPGTYAFKAEVKESIPASEYTLNIAQTVGGTVKVNDEAVTLPYSAVLPADTEVVLEAVNDTGKIFKGWSGSFGASDKKITFTLKENTNLAATFTEKTSPEYFKVNISAPANTGLKAKLGKVIYDLPGSVMVKEGDLASIEIIDSDDHRFVAWSGDMFTTANPLPLTLTENINMAVIAEYKGTENFALKKTATASNNYNGGSQWNLGNLTDGYTGVGPNNACGYTSGGLKPETIGENPEWVAVDLAGTGGAKTFDSLVLYPRIDLTDENGNTVNFPEKFTIQVSDDGSAWRDVQEVELTANPRGIPQEYHFETQTAKHVRILVTKLGTASLEGGVLWYRIQLAEMQVLNKNSNQGDKTLTITGTGKGEGQVRINGVLQDLPFSASYPNGTKLSVEAVPGADSQFVEWGGLIAGKEMIRYLEINRDITLTPSFGRTDAPDPERINLALGKTVTAKDESFKGNSAWTQANLTDGLLTSGIDGKNGYTSGGFDHNIMTESESPWVEIDLGADKDFNQITLYPRTGVAAAGGESPNFPTGFKVMVKMDGHTAYQTVYELTNGTTTAGQPRTYEFNLCNARYVRIVPTVLGSPASDEQTGFNRRLQLAEIEVCNYPPLTENFAVGAVISATDSYEAGATWSIRNLVDGIKRSQGRNLTSGIKGFTSGSTYPKDISSSPYHIDFELQSEQKIDRVILYPRSDTDAVSKDSLIASNIPESYSIQVKQNAGDAWKTVYAVTDGGNTGYHPQDCRFTPVSAKYVRVELTKLGEPTWDEGGTGNKRRVQFAEIHIGAQTVEAVTPGAITLDTAGGVPGQITSPDQLLGLIANVTNSSLSDNSVVWSLEDENGFVMNIADLYATNGNTPTVKPLLEGESYVVARFKNGLGMIDKLPIIIAYDSEPTPKVEAGIVDEDGNPVENPIFETNAPFTVSVTTPADVEHMKLVNENGMTIGKTVVSVTDNGDGTKIWILSLSVATAGAGRVLDIYTAGSDKEYSDTGAAVSFDIVGVTPAVISAVKTVAGSANVNEEFTITVETTKTIDKVKLSNETGNSIGVISKSFVIDGNKKIWTLTAKIGTKGDRIVTVYGAPKDTDYLEAGVSFNVTILKP